MTLAYKCLLGIVLMSAGNAHSQWQDLAAVRKAAESFVLDQVRTSGASVEVSASAPDSRLRLPYCPQLIAFSPPGARWWGPASVGIRCEAPATWSLYVPVTVRILDDAVVAARSIPKGHPITEGDLTVQQTDITRLTPGGTLTLEQVLGRTAKTPIAGGMILREDLLQAPPLVRQGDSVQLAFAGNGFEVHGRGRALTAGALGEAISVKSDSGKVVKGVVRARGSVYVH